MSDPVTATLVAGTALNAGGKLAAGSAAADAGRSQEKAAKFEAKQMRQQAGQERASSQRQAEQDRRKGRLTASRALAVAAASGGGASDTTVVEKIADIEAEGELNALAALFEGEERARTLETGAQVRRFEGRSERAAGDSRAIAGFVGATSTVLSDASSLFEKFGEDDEPGTIN